MMDLKKNIVKLLSSIEENPDYDLEEIQVLLLDAPTDEVRGAYRQITHLCHVLTEALIKTGRSVGGINLISNTICKVRTHESQLTSIHSDLCLLCLDAKCMNPAMKYLDTDYTDIKVSDDRDEDVKQIMLYYYYGGLIYTAIKQFERASFFFDVVLTMPANMMNSIMQESYKKQVILTLLRKGKISDTILPKYTSACVLSHRKTIGGHYLKLAQEYPSLNIEKIRKLVANGYHSFERDENLGLIRQCVSQVHSRNIKRLTKTFLTLALRDVADHVGLESEQEAERYILNMIDDGEIFATINQKDGMVVFQDSPETYESASIFQKLQEDMSVSTSLIEILKRMEVDGDIDKKSHTKLGIDTQ